MLLIFTPKITNRIKYSFSLIFKEILSVDFLITNNIEEFKQWEDIKFSYAKFPVEDELFFYAAGLLHETGIVYQPITSVNYKGIECLFTSTKRSVLPFDPFAACFYMVSRYEEYLPYLKDKYGCFCPLQSIAFQKGFLYKPAVNIWINMVVEAIKARYHDFKIIKKPYKFIPTYDINCAYAFKNKGFIRTIGGFTRDIFKKNIPEIKNRALVLINKRKDPYDSFDFQLNLQKQYGLKPIYFVLFAAYGTNDKNLYTGNQGFKSLLKSLGDYAEIGIHPSFASLENSKCLEEELNKLSQVLNKEITKARQHFMRLNLPFVYRSYINHGITDDYSMGYLTDIGFRAGIAHSFSFYDLDQEMQTNLRIHPFMIKDTTLKIHLEINPQNAKDIVKQLINETKAVNGTFISLWHNNSLGNSPEWQGWKNAYEEIIKMALP